MSQVRDELEQLLDDDDDDDDDDMVDTLDWQRRYSSISNFSVI